MFILSKEELLQSQTGLKLSGHSLTFLDHLLALELLGEAPTEIEFVGIVPSKIEPSQKLSSEVKKAVDKAIKEVLKLIGNNEGGEI